MGVFRVCPKPIQIFLVPAGNILVGDLGDLIRTVIENDFFDLFVMLLSGFEDDFTLLRCFQLVIKKIVFSPLKFSGLNDRVLASDKREMFPMFMFRPLNLFVRRSAS